jgi:CMP-N,N'-diacetyllegionaminic acid synthase
MNVVAIMFARAGSKGVSKKNTRKVLGRASCQYPILAARNAEFVNRIYVSTDDPRVKGIAEKYGVGVIERPASLARDETPLEAAIAHAYAAASDREKEPIDILVILQGNAPCVTAATIDEAVRNLRRDESLHAVASVADLSQYGPTRAKRLDDGVLVGTKARSSDRKAEGPVYFCDGGVVAVWANVIASMDERPGGHPWLGDRCGAVVQAPNPGDIDQEWQIGGVEAWLKEEGFTTGRTPYQRLRRLDVPSRSHTTNAEALDPMEVCRGKRVAVIGRAPYLLDSALGVEIDAHDVVIRVNWYLPVQKDHRAGAGERTDLLYLLASNGRINRVARAEQEGVKHTTKDVAVLSRVSRAAIATLGYRNVYRRYTPNTGTVCIFDALDHGAESVTAYGFDFHTTAHYGDIGQEHGNRQRWAGLRKAGAVRTHDPDVDMKLLAELAKRDSRFQPDEHMRKVLRGEEAAA